MATKLILFFFLSCVKRLSIGIVLSIIVAPRHSNLSGWFCEYLKCLAILEALYLKI